MLNEGDIPVWLDGEVALVTGGGAGIGRAIARMLARAGAHVAVLDRDEAAAARTAAEIGARAEAHYVHMQDLDAVRGVIDGVAGRHGRIDLLVNNAGLYPRITLAEAEPEAVRCLFAINVDGPLFAMQAACRHMKAGGRVINISSADSLRSTGAGFGPYGASKAAINALTRSAAVEYGPLGIRVNAVLPGVILSDGTSRTTEEFRREWAARTPARRIGGTDDVAAAVLFLAGPLAAFVHGHSMVVDGGLTIVA